MTYDIWFKKDLVPKNNALVVAKLSNLHSHDYICGTIFKRDKDVWIMREKQECVHFCHVEKWKELNE